MSTLRVNIIEGLGDLDVVQIPTGVSGQYVQEAFNGSYGAEIKSSDLITKGPWVDARAYGTLGTQAAIVAALADIGSDERTLYLAPGTWSISTSASIQANVNLKVEKGAVLTIAAAQTLTINGPLEAGLYQIFSCTGTGAVVLPTSLEKYPEWWGAVGDDSTDDTIALQAWATCGGNLWLPDNTYKITAVITVPQYTIIDGQGTIHQTTNTVGGLSVKDDVIVRNITLQATGTATSAAAYYYHLGIVSYSIYTNASTGTSLEATYVGNRVIVDNVTLSGGWVRAVVLTVDCTVKYCKIPNAVSEGILFYGPRNRAIFNTITNCGGWALDSNGGDCEISYNIVRTCATDSGFAGDAGGIAVAGLASWKPITNVRVIGNSIDGFQYGYGIVVISKPNDGVWGNITISDNYINGNDTTNTLIGIYMYVGAASTVTCKKFKVTNNIIENAVQGLQGVYLEDGVISGNVFKTIYPDNVTKHGAVELGAITRTVVSHNIISDVNGAANTALYLFSTVNNCKIINNIGEGGSVGILNATGMSGTNNSISDNDFSGCTTPIFLQGALPLGNRLERNLGYNPIIPATPAVPASGVEYPNNFGYPLMICITRGAGDVSVISKGPTGALTDTGLDLLVDRPTATIILGPGECVALTYAAAPTWVFFGL